MKKIVFAFISVTITVGSLAQNIFTYGKNAVTKEEFINAFNKNPNINGDRKKELKEYLNLYINFKLKVQAAYDARLDKDATQQYELQNFRNQLADNIINDQANIKELVKQAFERSKKEIHVAQIFIETPANGDTAEAYKQIQSALAQLKAGKDFAAVSQQFSSDESTRQTKGDLGYITVFTLPYDIENIVYNLKPNSFSQPVKTKSGFHLFKNVDERKSLGTRRIAQILIAIPPNATAEDKNNAARKADSIYNLLEKGHSFEELAVAVSNDLSSSNNRGELPQFTTGTYSPDFEAAAFALKNTGDLSKPFLTAYGYHIVKLLEARPVANDLNNETTFANLQSKVIRDNRLEKSKKELIQKNLSLIKFRPALYKEKDLFIFTDTALRNQNVTIVNGINKNTLLFSFARQNIRAADWVAFIKDRYSASAQPSQHNYTELFKEFVHTKADEYYRNNLEAYNPDFAKQVQEFKDANLLFGIMETNVWSKANTDSAGLRQYYDQHKSKYVWSSSADAIIITGHNQKLAEAMEQKLKDSVSNWRQITGSYGNDIVADSGRFELGQLPVFERTNFTPGLITAHVKNENDGSYTFNYIINVYQKPDQRSFEDARGLVIGDYQQVLEDRWMTELKKKYQVKVNEAAFETIK